MYVIQSVGTELFHVICRWYDYIPCIGRVHGSWNDGGVDVLCFVRLSTFSSSLLPLTFCVVL